MLLQHTEAKLGHLRYHNKTIERLFYNQPKYRLENILAMITSWRTCSICEKYEASVSMADLNGELSWERREKYLTQSVSNLIPAILDPLFLVCSPFPNANKQFHTQIGKMFQKQCFQMFPQPNNERSKHIYFRLSKPLFGHERLKYWVLWGRYNKISMQCLYKSWLANPGLTPGSELMHSKDLGMCLAAEKENLAEN